MLPPIHATAVQLEPKLTLRPELFEQALERAQRQDPDLGEPSSLRVERVRFFWQPSACIDTPVTRSDNTCRARNLSSAMVAAQSLPVALDQALGAAKIHISPRTTRHCSLRAFTATSHEMPSSLELIQIPHLRSSIRLNLEGADLIRFNQAVGVEEDRHLEAGVYLRRLEVFLGRAPGSLTGRDVSSPPKEAFQAVLMPFETALRRRPGLRRELHQFDLPVAQFTNRAVQFDLETIATRIQNYHDAMVRRNQKLAKGAALLTASVAGELCGIFHFEKAYRAGKMATRGWEFVQTTATYVRNLPEEWYRTPLRYYRGRPIYPMSPEEKLLSCKIYLTVACLGAAVWANSFREEYQQLQREVVTARTWLEARYLTPV